MDAPHVFRRSTRSPRALQIAKSEDAFGAKQSLATRERTPHRRAISVQETDERTLKKLSSR